MPTGMTPPPEGWKSVFRQLGILALFAATLFLYMKSPAERTYWPYMLCGYLIGAFVYFREPAESRTGIFRYLFPAEIWTHRSSVNDCLMALVNIVFIAVVYRYTVLNPGIIITYARKAGDAFSGLERQDPPGVAAVVLYTVSALLASDLFYYVSHRLSHRIPFLWEFHKVHHSAQVMTPLTLYRMHPVDFWQNTVFRAIGLGLTAFVFVYLYPGAWSMVLVGGVNAGIVIGNIVGANLRHSHIWLSFGPAIEHVILSPAQHQIHHSTNPRHFDKNYASLLTVWDWIFGSLYVPKEREHVTFGLGSEELDRPYASIWGMCLHPFKAMFGRRAGG